MKKVKIITCIYSFLHGSKLGGRSGRDHHYRLSLLSLLKMTDADFLCYTGKDEIESLKKFFYEDNSVSESQLKFSVFNLENCEYSDILDTLKIDGQNFVPDRCYEIQYSKFSWFKNEIKDYDYYYWFDAGLSHTGLIPDKYLNGEGYRCYFESTLFNNNFLKKLNDFSENKFVVVTKENSRNYWETTVSPEFYDNYDNSVHVIGGFFGGKVDLWDNIVDKFDHYVRLILPIQRRFFYEEHFMSLMYQNHKELFKPLNFDIWWHEDNHKEGTEEFFKTNKSFYKILEELNG